MSSPLKPWQEYPLEPGSKRMTREGTEQWWRDRVAHYPLVAFCDVPTEHLSPRHIDQEKFGIIVSGGFSLKQVRTYGFTSQAHRDRFLNTYRHLGAKPSQDPLQPKKAKK